ncbi:unnamed protein product [marine sediment metagenome]|uniref:Uncharacterized protein n=1 Tax=marine sediment metagenome TaxID=412755 RepID=X0VKK5_9ZZZZ
MANGTLNGKTKVVIALLTLALTFTGGIAAGGYFMGGLNNIVKDHVAETDIHPSSQDRADETRVLVDRELWPMFKHLQEQLTRIEKKIGDGG